MPLALESLQWEKIPLSLINMRNSRLVGLCRADHAGEKGSFTRTIPTAQCEGLSAVERALRKHLGAQYEMCLQCPSGRGECVITWNILSCDTWGAPGWNQLPSAQGAAGEVYKGVCLSSYLLVPVVLCSGKWFCHYVLSMVRDQKLSSSWQKVWTSGEASY